MFALILFGAIAFWMFLTLILANWIGNFLPQTPWRIGAKFLLIPIIFIAPLADEIISIPEMKSLCEQKKAPIVGKDIGERTDAGLIARSKIETEYITLSTGIRILLKRHDYIDVNSKNLVLREYYEVRPIKSLIAYPDAGGSRNLWILKKCDLESTNSISKTQFRQKVLGIREILD